MNDPVLPLHHAARVTVTLKPGVLDPQGQAIAHALGTLGFAGVLGARQGKLIELGLAAAGQLGFEADDLVVQHGAGDLNALALGHHGVGEERIGFDSRRGGGGGCLRRLVRRGAPGGNGRRQQEGHGKS